MTPKELREQRAKLAARIKEMADTLTGDKRDFTAAEKPNWEQLNKDYDALTRQIEIAERAANVTAEQDEPAAPARRNGKGKPGVKPGREDRDTAGERDGDEPETDVLGELGLVEQRLDPRVFNLALQGWMLRQTGKDVEVRHKKAAKIAGISLTQRYLDINLNKRAMTGREFRATSPMGSIDLSKGGTLVEPLGFAGALERALLMFGPMRQEAQVLRTPTGAELPWPTADDTAQEGSIVGENVAVTDDTLPTFGLPKFSAYKYKSGLIKVPVELLEDAAFDVASLVGEMLGERIARRQNRDFTTGDGAGKATGIVTAATLGKTTAGATAITADELIDLIHSVDPAYRPSCKFMFHDNVLAYIRKLKDSQNRYLFQDSAMAGASPTIHGCGYVINQNMQSSVATATKTVVFGKLDQYKIRDVGSIRIRRLVERFADSDQEGFIAFMRSDGNLLDAGTHPVKYMLQA